MKTIRRIVKLLPPAFLMRGWLDWRYGIKAPLVPGGVVARFVLAVLPYAFTAALSVRVDSDRRLLKYFLPYGNMKRHVRLAHNMNVGNDACDRGVTGMVRAIMPYGLVLWWDAETGRQPPSFGGTRQICGDRRISEKVRTELGRRELERMDRLEAMTLRLLIMTSGGQRSDE